MLQQLKSLTRDSMIYGVGHIATRLLTFLLLPYYSFQMAPAAYGEITLYFLFVGVVQTFFLYGLDIAYLRYFALAKEPEKRRTVNGTTLAASLATTVSLTALLLLAAPFLGHLVIHDPVDPGSVPAMVRICAGILFFDTLSAFPYLYLRNTLRPYFFTAVKLLNVGVNIGLNIWFLSGLRMGVAGVLWANFVASAITTIVLTPVFLRGVSLRFDRELLREMIRFGIPNVPTYLFVMVIELAGRKIIEFYRGISEAGLYSAGYKLGMFIAVVTGAFRFAWQPFFLSHAGRPDAPRLFARVLTYYLLVTTALFLFLTFFIDAIVKTRWPGIGFILHPQYWPGLVVFPLILLAHIFDGVYANLMVGIYIKKMTSRLPMVTGVGALFTIIFCMLLVPKYGMLAAAWVTLGSFILEAVMIWLVVRKEYPVPYEWVKILKLGVACGIVLAISYLPGFRDVWQRGILLLAFPVLLFIFGFFDERERFYMQKLLSRR